MNKSVVAFAVAAVLLAARPSSAAAPSSDLLACGNITDSQARLACFDRELAKSRPAAPAAAPTGTPPPAVAPAPVPAPVPAPAAAVAPAAAAPATTAPAAAPPPAAQSFGQEDLASKKAPSAAPVEQMHARLSSQKEIGSSRTYNLFLDNGQVWRHENTHLGSYLREGDAVTITKATLGSYRLTRDAGAAKDWIKVTRVR